MHFIHSHDIWSDYPELVAGVISVASITKDASVSTRTAHFHGIAEARLAAHSEGEFPEIQAWRRTFSRMGLKPTQYRCASESLLRRFKKERSLPSIHPLIDLCNAVSMAFAIPVAVFDVANVANHIEVRYAEGNEVYTSFGGETEHPEAREVVFADAHGHAHARRWTHRQSAESAIRNETATVLIVAEAMHASAPTDVPRLIAVLADEIRSLWSATAKSAVLSVTSPRFEF